MNNIEYYISTVNDGNLALHIGDNEQNVTLNRTKLASKLGYGLEDFVYLQQVHGSDILMINNSLLNSLPFQGKEATGDASITKEKGIILSILVADCVPIIIYDDINSIVGVVHAGWKSTNKNIIKNTLSDMIKLGADLENIKVIIGPSISECSYEIGEEVGNNFREEVKTKIINNKQYLNLKKENNLQAIESGVKESNIEVINIDTFTDYNYFSARRDGFGKGRFGAFIWIK